MRTGWWKELQELLHSLLNLGEKLISSTPIGFLIHLVHRNPNNATDLVLKDMHWPVHDSEQEFYLEIGYHFTEKQGLALERYAVWDELEKSGSLGLKTSYAVLLLGTVLSLHFSCNY